MDYQERLQGFLKKAKADFSFDSIAVRVLDPLGYIPYVAYDGLTSSFIEDEEILTTNDCVCGKVARLDALDNSPFFTKGGSFWSNYLKEDDIEELKKSGIEHRGRCLQEGYKTHLITPVKTGNGGGGVLYFASKKENLLSEKDVYLLEDSVRMLGEDVFKQMTECERYSIKTHWIAQDNANDPVRFGKYFEHIKNCPACHEFYHCNLEFDDVLGKFMAQPAPPLQELKSKIMGNLRSTNAMEQ